MTNISSEPGANLVSSVFHGTLGRFISSAMLAATLAGVNLPANANAAENAIPKAVAVNGDNLISPPNVYVYDYQTRTYRPAQPGEKAAIYYHVKLDKKTGKVVHIQELPPTNQSNTSLLKKFYNAGEGLTNRASGVMSVVQHKLGTGLAEGHRNTRPIAQAQARPAVAHSTSTGNNASIIEGLKNRPKGNLGKEALKKARTEFWTHIQGASPISLKLVLKDLYALESQQDGILALANHMRKEEEPEITSCENLVTWMSKNGCHPNFVEAILHGPMSVK